MPLLTPNQAINSQPFRDLASVGRELAFSKSSDVTPEVSEVLVQMPWWVARGLLYVIVGFVVTILVWARFSFVDVIVESRGVLVPEGYVRPVQVISNGVVQYVRVREGDTVSRGQMLFQLDTTELRTKGGKLREELATNEEQFRQLLAVRGPVGESLEKQNSITRLKDEIAGVELALSQTTIKAPMSGVITELGVRSPGSVVHAGQQVAAIAPAGARLVAEAQVRNKDITFIEKGLSVKLKLDAFPFQDYGSLRGTITQVSPDAQSHDQQGSFYKLIIAPQHALITANGRAVPLRPGLTLTAEIITEHKSVLALMLEPFRKLKAQMGGIS